MQRVDHIGHVSLRDPEAKYVGCVSRTPSRTYRLERCSIMLIIGVWIVPIVSFAQVRITEVAWMGSIDNANAEWIELFTEADVDVTGWTLVAEDGQPSVTLDGTIKGGVYALLERTSDDTVPGVTAHQVYTGALGNTSEVLVLRNGAGAEVDRVEGGEDWALGGDNSEKHTLQRVGNGWATAPPTPGAANAQEGVPPSTNATRSEDRPETGSSEPASSAKEKQVVAKTNALPVPKAPALTLAIGNERTVSIGMAVRLVAETENEEGKSLGLDTVAWSFGDGGTGVGTSIVHRYEYPGDYAVIARVSHARANRTLTAEARTVVHVREAPVVLTEADMRSIKLVNTGMTEVDLSGFFLVAGKRTFVLPAGTLMLPSASIRLPTSVTKLVVNDPHEVALFYPNRTLAAWYGDAYVHETALTENGDMPQITEDAEEPSVVTSLHEVSVVPVETDTVAVEDTVAENEHAVPLAQAMTATAGVARTAELWWYLIGVAVLAGMGAAVILLVRREQETEEELLAAEVAAYEIEAPPPPKRARRRTTEQDALY